VVRILLPLVLVLVVAFLVVMVARAPRGQPAPTWGEAVPEVPEPSDERAAAVETARQRLRRAETRYAERVRSAEEGLTRARQDTEVLRLDGVVLGRCTVLVAGREHELTEDTRFAFSHEGSVAYRVDEDGASSLIVEDDRRRGRLTVQGPGWEDGTDVLPAEFAEAERLVAAGQAATRTVAAAQRERAERVQRAWVELEEARAARAELDEARLTVEDLLGAGPWVWDVPDPPEEQ
jgi:hypothetical protein